MRIGKRLFPYPLLNSQKLYSQFQNCSFALSYDDETTDEAYILSNIVCKLDNTSLISLINDEKAKVVLAVECNPSMFRKIYDIQINIPNRIEIPIRDVFGKISVAAYVIALDDIHGYISDDFDEVYKGYSFTIEKYDILAADDGFTNKIDFKDEDSIKKSSIYEVIKDSTSTDGVCTIDFDLNKITIYVPEKQWNYYEKTKKEPHFRNIYFTELAVQSLTYSLLKLQKKAEDVYDDIESIGMDYEWFNSFIEGYKKIHNKELNIDDFKDMDPYVESQKIFDAPVSKSFDEIFSLVINGMQDEGDNDDN